MEAMAWAFARPCPTGPRFVLVTLANSCGPQGVTFCGQQKIAEMTEMGLRTVSGHMNKLEEMRLIARAPRFRRNGSRTSDWTVLGPGCDRGTMHLPDPEEQPAVLLELALGRPHADSAGGRFLHSPHAESAGPPEPLEEPSVSLERAGAREPGSRRRPITYRGMRVPKDVAIAAAALLVVYNEVAGRSVGPRGRDGGASPALRQIIGAMMSRPDVPLADWEAAVRNTAENPPEWVDGVLQIGHVFGERAAEWALANSGRRAEVIRSNQSEAARDTDDRFLASLARFTGESA